MRPDSIWYCSRPRWLSAFGYAPPRHLDSIEAGPCRLVLGQRSHPDCSVSARSHVKAITAKRGYRSLAGGPGRVAVPRFTVKIHCHKVSFLGSRHHLQLHIASSLATRHTMQLPEAKGLAIRHPMQLREASSLPTRHNMQQPRELMLLANRHTMQPRELSSLANRHTNKGRRIGFSLWGMPRHQTFRHHLIIKSPREKQKSRRSLSSARIVGVASTQKALIGTDEFVRRCSARKGSSSTVLPTVLASLKMLERS
mmetsp:Transcript_118363/g.209194  ORF Transcript_118363/g.209194 Transcript_118363/m.209194 type:complete len:254 (-) Transcript_118363:622-1383(-)